jgi:hypothetical protein
MKTTFEKFINDDPVEKKEFIYEKMDEEHLSVRTLAEKADVSPTVIQKLRSSSTADHISYKTFLSVIDSLGYGFKLVKK